MSRAVLSNAVGVGLRLAQGQGEAVTTRATLDAALLKAHDDDDKSALVRLYTDAANLAQTESDNQAMCFYLTHAYVFALEIGAPEANVLHARLKAEGREE